MAENESKGSGGAVAKADPTAIAKNSIYAILTNEKTLAAIKDALPDLGVTPQRVASVAFSVIAQRADLLACDARSLVRVIIEGSLLGLSFNPHLKQAAIVPFKNTVDGKKVATATLIIEYMGLVHLARNSGVLSDVDAHIVHEKDAFDYEEGLQPKLYHKPARGVRGKPIGVYAVATLANGTKKFRFLEEADVNFYREKSRAKDSPDSPWTTDPMSMWRKTAIRRLCSYLPMDDRMQRAMYQDELAETGHDQVLAPEVFGGVIDVEPSSEPKKTKTEQRKEALKGKTVVAEPVTETEPQTEPAGGGGGDPQPEEPAQAKENEADRKKQFTMTFNVISSMARNEAEADVMVSEATSGKVQKLAVLKETGTIEQMKMVEDHCRKLAAEKKP